MLLTSLPALLEFFIAFLCIEGMTLILGTHYSSNIVIGLLTWFPGEMLSIWLTFHTTLSFKMFCFITHGKILLKSYILTRFPIWQYSILYENGLPSRVRYCCYWLISSFRMGGVATVSCHHDIFLLFPHFTDEPQYTPLSLVWIP